MAADSPPAANEGDVVDVKVGLNEAAAATVNTPVDWDSKMTQASTTRRKGGEKVDEGEEVKENLAAAALEGRDDDQHE